MKILIIGSKGNLGTQLVSFFAADEKYEVIAWDRGDIDITDANMVRDKILDLKPEIIINATGYNAVDKCEESDEEFKLAKKLNGDAISYLADASLELDALFITLTSDYVFDGEKIDGYQESDETNPISKYAKTKVMGEQELFKREDQGLKFYLIRTSKLFGPRGKGDNTKESFFDLILRLSADKKEFNMIDGEEISCFTYVVDLAQAIKKLIENKKEYGAYHLVNEGAASWYDGAKYMFELKNITDIKLNPVKMEDYPRPAKRPRYSVLLNTKAEKLRSWKDALAEYFS